MPQLYQTMNIRRLKERRIKRNIKTWRKDLNKVKEVRRGNMRLKQRERERVNRKYHLEERGTLYVSGMLKQKIKAGGVDLVQGF